MSNEFCVKQSLDFYIILTSTIEFNLPIYISWPLKSDLSLQWIRSYSAKERLNYLYLFTQKSESRNPANDPLGNIPG